MAEEACHGFGSTTQVGLTQALGLMISYRTYPAIMSTSIFLVTFAVSAILMQLLPSICWLPRIGGTLVGVSVVIQGYMQANAANFRKPWRWGLTREQIYAHFTYQLAFFGTFMWAFGDMIPGVLWLSNATCTAQL